MTSEALIIDAIMRANQCGAKGVQVVGYGISATATQDPRYALMVLYPARQSDSETPWYEEQAASDRPWWWREKR